jgi:hypothetical protein
LKNSLLFIHHITSEFYYEQQNFYLSGLLRSARPFSDRLSKDTSFLGVRQNASDLSNAVAAQVDGGRLYLCRMIRVDAVAQGTPMPSCE